MSASIYLASQSPRRRELLEQINIGYELLSASIDETPLDNEAAADYVKRLAVEKARAGQAFATENKPVLGADTIVVIDEKLLGKPRDQEHAISMLMALSNRQHQVMTAVALVLDDEVVCDVVTTSVTFRAISEQEALNYWHSGEPKDKAGGYGIQGLGGQFVEKIDGCYFAVVGLPLMKTQQLIAELLSTQK
ncbi:Maf family nucleotide pyrophosphatase [Psychrobium sp. MM17-31]|uniref:Maf family protein n=1 Tax=Psychrobium sp. MM17-31 TaxID=2917758 RepID=UPI001EF4B98A|nr:Maf family protein [Psychrobium sp. MM17-31]MCG7532363.1 Maf family nucleotide pyrophosphatase [Psychrobium sp. MM17-31]